MIKATKKATVKALRAVKNHPLITVITPVMRFTALSLPQALSAKEVPMITMKVTYVVERGSLRDVPIAMSILAKTRFTEALSMSKEIDCSFFR
ncbi:hypothetical protein ES705_13394 [subsurface metagenome]